MSDPLQISKLVSRVLDGEIRVPGFQRNYVWEPERAALLMDSIYKEYPFGSILLWQTRTRMKTEKDLGAYTLPAPKVDFPINYVLDGQQRITSIFSTFQTELKPTHENPEVWLPIFYDFEAKADAQDSQFVALAEADADPERYFPLSVFFDAIQFSKKQRMLQDDRLEEIVKVQTRFNGTLIPVETFSKEDRTSVAIVFERVNRQGVKLDTFQLLTAWTWSDEFDLQQKFNDLAERFEAFGFDDVGTDNDLMLRCASAVLKGDPSPTALIDINGAAVRQQFDSIVKALERAIDFLRDELQIRHYKFLPYPALLVPLCAYFSKNQSASVPIEHQTRLLRWFWRTTFTHRYSGNPPQKVRKDVLEAINLREGRESELDHIGAEISADFYLSNTFNNRTVATKAFILQLARHAPRSFLGGRKISLDDVIGEPNRREYHHCYPRAYIARIEKDGNCKHDYNVNCLANMAFLSRAENRTISDNAPSVYKNLMKDQVSEILASQLVPDALFDDDFDEFAVARMKLLTDDAAELQGIRLGIRENGMEPGSAMFDSLAEPSNQSDPPA